MTLVELILLKLAFSCAKIISMCNNVRRFYGLFFVATVLLCFLTVFSCSDLFSDTTTNYTHLTVNITLLGKNSIEGYNHGGIKLSSESNGIYNDNAVINLVFDTPSTGTFRFDSFDDKDIQVEHVTANFSIASGCTFSGTVGTQSYTNPDEFFAAAQNSTIGSEFTITR